MENKPFISVMILCYNYSKLLKKALAACASQTFKNFEIVMINNGSTDDTEKVFLEFCQKNPGIQTQYVDITRNQGPTHGWNVGLEYAQGEYVLFNDADDWMDSDCLEILANAAKKTNADRITGRYREITPEGKILRERKIKSANKLPTIMLQATLFKKSVVKQNDISFPEDVLIPYDAAFVFEFAYNERSFANITNKTIYNYYCNPVSVSHKTTAETYFNKRINLHLIPFSNVALSAVKSTSDINLKMQIQYLFIRCQLADLFNDSISYRGNDFCELCENMLKVINGFSLEIKHNKYIKPFFNGYENPGSFAIWCLYLLLKLKLLKPLLVFLNKIKRL